MNHPWFSSSPEILGHAVQILQHVRSISVPILTDEFRKILLEEANLYPLRAAKNTVGTANNLVHQDMLLQDQLKSDGAFAELVIAFQQHFDEAISEHSYFSAPVVFNDVMLQKYEPNSVGITPHRDRTDYRHIICLFVLEGLGRFYIADDRTKKNAMEIANLPGDVVLMPGPGFVRLNHRPFHYLENITQQRWVFGLRHDQSKLV